ncbi:MAG: YfhO family protein, partial [Desulforhabdus sp.]|nr:YfhO family protein [Desulforhabdus sp.]
AMELGNLSLRQQLSFNEFNSYSLPADQIHGLLFPYLFGGSSACPFWQPYFGLWNHGELTGYAGLTTLILAAVGIVLSQEKLLKWFYLAVAAVAILLALGDATPLARFVFHLPGLNKFRAPARHLLEFTFAVSLLAGLGVAAIEKQSGSAKRALFPLLIGSGVIFGALLTTYLLSDRLKAMALKKGIEAISFVPWSNPALGLPTIILLLAILTAILWLAKPSSWVRRTLLVAVLIVDVGSYSFHTSVLYFPAASKDVLTPPAFVDAYRESLAPEQQRLLSVRGWQVEAVVPPNLSRLWNVPSAGCYGPLMISRVGTLLGMDSSGYVYGPWFDDSDQTLDVLAVKYVFDSKPGQNRVSIDADHYKWAPENGNLKLGSSCGNHVLRKEAFFKISPPFRSTGIGIVSLLVCSTEIKNNEAVLEVAVEDSAANVQIQTVRAGRDSSEWAYGCAAVARPIQHEQACVFDSVPGRDCEGHRYVAFLPFEGAPEVKEIRLRWTGTSGAIIIDKMSLFNELDRQAYLIDPSVSSVEGVKRWRQEAIEVPTRVYRNLRAMPRAWLVPETVSARPEEILSSVQSSTLPDGRSFDCSRIALVEEPLAFKVENFDKTAKIKNLSATNTRVKLRTSANSPSFLVLSDVNYPGWRVTIDGKKEHLYQANYVSRGVIVPAGEHEIVFRFRPTMFYFGLAISAFSAVSILLIVIFRKKIAGLFGEPSR